MKKEKVIVLLSGGLDSCVTTAICNAEYNINLLHINYGQLTDNREEKSFYDIAKYYQIKKKLNINIGYLKEIGGSSLTNGKYLKNSSSGDVPDTYVPFRNANLLAIAVSWAETIGINKIFIGAMEEDSSGYPDCTEKFFKSFNDMVQNGTKNKTNIQVKTPILHKSKSEVVKIGFKLHAPLHLTWSCYRNSDVACGKCDSCKLRIKAFKKAGCRDPIPYEIPLTW